jgi:hypothetical protein
MMVRRHFYPVTVLALLLAAIPVAALTVERQVTPQYLKAHPQEFSLKAEMREDGLVHFTLKRTLPGPKYLVARLILKQDGKKIADVSTPSFGRKDENSFYVALSPAQLAEAEYSLSESSLGGPLTDPVPLPSTTVYKFNLKDFVK